MASSPHVRDVSAERFADDVLARSHDKPIVVDFWAAWCAPCRMLAPILEKEIDALGGRVELAKIDTDAAPSIAAQYQIQGIPAVKAFRDGQVVAEFVGAKPAAFIKSWLAQLAPPPGVEALARAEAALKEGRRDEAEAQLRALVDDAAAKDAARLALARLLLESSRPDEVPALLAGIDPRSDAADAVPSLERLLAFAADAAAYGGEDRARAAVEANGRDLDARWALASALAARADHAGALEHLLEIVGRNRKFKDDGARLAMLAIFDALGPEHPLTGEYRRKLQIVL